MVRNLCPVWVVFFFGNIIKVKHFYNVSLYCYLLFFSLHSRFLLVSYAYVSIEPIDCMLLSTFELKAILLVSSVKILCFPLLNLCCVLNISLFFMNCLWSSLRLSTPFLFFPKRFILFSSWASSLLFFPKWSILFSSWASSTLRFLFMTHLFVAFTFLSSVPSFIR